MATRLDLCVRGVDLFTARSKLTGNRVRQGFWWRTCSRRARLRVLEEARPPSCEWRSSVPSGFGRAPFWARWRLSLFKIARKDLRTRARGAGGEHISSYLRPFPSSQHSHRVCDQISLSLLLRPWRKPRRTSPHRRPRRPRQVHRPVHHPRSPPLCPPHRLRPPPRPHRRAREGSSIGE